MTKERNIYVALDAGIVLHYEDDYVTAEVALQQTPGDNTGRKIVGSGRAGASEIAVKMALEAAAKFVGKGGFLKIKEDA